MRAAYNEHGRLQGGRPDLYCLGEVSSLSESNDAGTAPQRRRKSNYAYFRVTSTVLSLEDITELVGEQPDSGFSVGDRIQRPGMIAERRYAFTSWERHSPTSPGASVRESVDGLLEPVRRISGRLVGRFDVTCELQVVQYMSSGNELGFGVYSEWVELLASLRAGVDIDQYW